MHAHLNRSTHLFTAISLLLPILLVFGCSSGSASTSTTLLMPPLERPPAIRDWEGISVRTIYLDRHISFPQLGQPESLPESIADTSAVSLILSRLGFEVVGEEALGDATLTLTMTGEALSANYQGTGGGNAYTGGRVDGEMSLSAEGQKTLTLPLDNDVPVSQVIDRADTHQLEDFRFTPIWVTPLLDDLALLLGPQTYVWALDLDRVALERLMVVGPVDEVVAALAYASQSDSPQLRSAVAKLLSPFKWGEDVEAAVPLLIGFLDDEDHQTVFESLAALDAFGPRAVSAVPALIAVFDDHPDSKNLKRIAIDTLRKITGQDFGDDATEWNDWWRENSG